MKQIFKIIALVTISMINSRKRSEVKFSFWITNVFIDERNSREIRTLMFWEITDVENKFGKPLRKKLITSYAGPLGIGIE